MKITRVNLKTGETIEEEMSSEDELDLINAHNAIENVKRDERIKQKKREFSERFFDVISNYKKRGTKPRNMDALMDDLFIQMDDLEVDNGA